MFPSPSSTLSFPSPLFFLLSLAGFSFLHLVAFFSCSPFFDPLHFASPTLGVVWSCPLFLPFPGALQYLLSSGLYTNSLALPTWRFLSFPNEPFLDFPGPEQKLLPPFFHTLRVSQPPSHGLLLVLNICPNLQILRPSVEVSPKVGLSPFFTWQ